MKKFKSHFRFNKQERSGIFFLLLFIVFLQVGYFVYRTYSPEISENSFSVDREIQAEIESLKQKVLQKDTIKIFPFNPNFITDYKGYTLGMSNEEIDRLHAYRTQNKFANSSEEFQEVTRISDSLLHAISPYFQFPEWTQNKGGNEVEPPRQSNERVYPPNEKQVVNTLTVQDLNTASAEQLKSVNGIGDKLSARIVKFRDRLGGFLVVEQLNDVYGLEADVAARTLERFKLLSIPEIEKININEASAYDIAKLVYISRAVAESIVSYRNLNGGINSFDELSTIENFPTDKIDRLTLYLSL
ncbi:MAG: helix-hairpin-helix domain-containing protein [Flavobacteriaceae bacterium]